MRVHPVVELIDRLRFDPVPVKQLQSEQKPQAVVVINVSIDMFPNQSLHFLSPKDPVAGQMTVVRHLLDQ